MGTILVCVGWLEFPSGVPGFIVAAGNHESAPESIAAVIFLSPFTLPFLATGPALLFFGCVCDVLNQIRWLNSVQASQAKKQNELFELLLELLLNQVQKQQATDSLSTTQPKDN